MNAAKLANRKLRSPNCAGPSALATISPAVNERTTRSPLAKRENRMRNRTEKRSEPALFPGLDIERIGYAIDPGSLDASQVQGRDPRLSVLPAGDLLEARFGQGLPDLLEIDDVNVAVRRLLLGRLQRDAPVAECVEI